MIRSLTLQSPLFAFDEHVDKGMDFFALPVLGRRPSYDCSFLIDQEGGRYPFHPKSVEAFTFWVEQNKEGVAVFIKKFFNWF